MPLHLESPAFGPGEEIPRRYTCEGDNLSPPFNWSGVPTGTAELLLVCDDPDAPSGVFHHWALFGIPPHLAGLDEGVGPESLREGLKQAINDFGKPGYAGPCPPPGHGKHHYHFRLSALARPVNPAAPGAGCVEIMQLARPHVIEHAELTGTFGR